MKSLLLSAILTVFCCCSRTSEAQAQYSVIYNFCSQANCADGNGPSTALIQASDGYFYGATGYEIYKISPTGMFTVLYIFCTVSGCPDGQFPQQNLIEGVDGNFYGVNIGGGTGANGTIFKLTKDGVYSIIHTFCSVANCADGTGSEGGVIQDASGNFYGTTFAGGAYNKGTIYELSNTGKFTTLYSFCAKSGCPDGYYPTGNLVQGSDGNLYGTTEYGGKQTTKGLPTGPQGTVFQVSPTTGFRTLYTFCENENCSDGAEPLDGVVEAADGEYWGGTIGQVAAIFDVSASGSESTDGYFCNAAVEGCELNIYPPAGPLFLASDRNLYGVSPAVLPSGSEFYNYGNIFTPGNPVASLYDFCPTGTSCPYGIDPAVSVVQGSDGALYGAAQGGGANGKGVIYKLTDDGLGPVQLTPAVQTAEPGVPFTMNYSVLNAFSDTMQNCVAYAPTGAGNWSGLQTGTPSSSGYSGSTSVTPTAVGTYTYALTCGGVESGFATLAVTANGKIASSTTMTASPNPATTGAQITLTATVTSTGAAVPTGTVTFMTGSTKIGSATLTNGVATFAASSAGIPAGSYPVTAKYSGDENYDASQSAAVDVVLKAETTATTLTLTATPNPIYYGQKVSLTATVTPASGLQVNAGQVVFSSGSTTLATVTVSVSGVAQYLVSGLPLGATSFTAAYQGSEPWKPSSGNATANVVINPTTVTLTGTPSPVIQGNEETLNATVTRTDGQGMPTGTVVFTSQGMTLGPKTLTDGSANSAVAAIVASTVGVPVGTYQVTATYQGDADDSKSTSAPISVTVQAPGQ